VSTFNARIAATVGVQANDQQQEMTDIKESVAQLYARCTDVLLAVLNELSYIHVVTSRHVSEHERAIAHELASYTDVFE
jgi:broad specificity phosphatase PhoE